MTGLTPVGWRSFPNCHVPAVASVTKTMHRDPPLGELADAATLALLLALADLPPHERLAFILQRVFGLSDDVVVAALAPPRAGDAPSPPRAGA